MYLQARTQKFDKKLKACQTVEDRNALILASGAPAVSEKMDTDTGEVFYRPRIGEFTIYGVEDSDDFKYSTLKEASEKAHELKRIIERENYVPFGEDWEKAVKKQWNKNQLVFQLKKALIEIQEMKATPESFVDYKSKYEKCLEEKTKGNVIFCTIDEFDNKTIREAGHYAVWLERDFIHEGKKYQGFSSAILQYSPKEGFEDTTTWIEKVPDANLHFMFLTKFPYDEDCF